MVSQASQDLIDALASVGPENAYAAPADQHRLMLALLTWLNLNAEGAADVDVMLALEAAVWRSSLTAQQSHRPAA